MCVRSSAAVSQATELVQQLAEANTIAQSSRSKYTQLLVELEVRPLPDEVPLLACPFCQCAFWKIMYLGRLS